MFGPREGSSRRPEEGGRVVDSRFKKVGSAIDLDSRVSLLLGFFCNRIFVREFCFFFAYFRHASKLVSTGFILCLLHFELYYVKLNL